MLIHLCQVALVPLWGIDDFIFLKNLDGWFIREGDGLGGGSGSGSLENRDGLGMTRERLIQVSLVFSEKIRIAIHVYTTGCHPFIDINLGS